MSTTKRRESARRIKAQDGTVLCSCGCGQAPKPPRRTWFSDACVEAWKIKNDPGYVRQRVYERDRGICAVCGCDAVESFRQWCAGRREAARLADWLLRSWRYSVDWHRGRWVFRTGDHPAPKEAQAYRARILALYGPSGNWTTGRSTGWDADHIVPVCRGGGQCGLDNYRTLCHPCHKAETAKLSKRRAQDRRERIQPALL